MDRDPNMVFEAIRAFRILFAGSPMQRASEAIDIAQRESPHPSPKITREKLKLFAEGSIVSQKSDFAGLLDVSARILLISPDLDERSAVLFCREVLRVMRNDRRSSELGGVGSWLSFLKSSLRDNIFPLLFRSIRYTRTLQEQLDVFEVLLNFPTTYHASDEHASQFVQFFDFPLKDSLCRKSETDIPTLMSLAAKAAVVNCVPGLRGASAVFPQPCMDILRREYELFSGFKFMNGDLREQARRMLRRLLDSPGLLDATRSQISSRLHFLQSLEES
jgi:hypothetical protein